MEPENKIENKNVQTYAEDMAKVIEGNEGRMIKKIIHEQEENEAVKEDLSPKSQKNKLFMVVSLWMVFLAVCVLIVLGLLKQKINTVDIITQSAPPIFIDQNYFQDITGLTKDQIAQSILNEVSATEVKNGGVEAIYLTENKQTIGLRKFIKLIKGGLNLANNSFVGDDFLIGAANQNTKNLFILLKVRSFADIFDGLRAWENQMFSDLHGFFGIDVNTTTKTLLTKNFEDGVIANKNARILRDSDGSIALMYVFADDNSVIITNSEDAVTEVILRLTASQIKK
jgi:hypothetical protein